MNLSRTLVTSAVIAALGGFLFGFDTVVISGAEQKYQVVWQLSDTMHGLATSAALWGTVLGSIIGSWPTDRFGRRPTLLAIGILYLVGAIWSGLAWDFYSFFIARFIGGVGIGVSTVAAPLYIAEIAPPAFRGRLTGMFQFNIVLGILVAFLSNWLLSGTSDYDWRWMLGVAAIPSLLYTLLCFFIPESPRWLINARGQRAEGIRVLSEVNPSASAAQLEQMADEIASNGNSGGAANYPFWSQRMKYPIMIAFLVAAFNQLSGINAILYFAPRILGMTGMEEQAAFVGSIGVGLINLVFTMLGVWLIDRAGRRTLLYIGSFGYIASLGLITYMFVIHQTEFGVANDALVTRQAYDTLTKAETAAQLPAERIATMRTNADKALTKLNETLAQRRYSGDTTPLPADSTPEQIDVRTKSLVDEAASFAGSGGTLVLWGIFAFIAAHAVGQGAVIWVLISEVFPNEHRAAGQSLGSATHWVFAAVITLVFPWFVSHFPPSVVFGFFCAMMVLQLLWVATMVPETKGVPLEELQSRLGVA